MRKISTPKKEEVTGRLKKLHTLKLRGFHSPLNTGSEQMKVYKTDGACSAYERQRKCIYITVLLGKPAGQRPREKPGRK